MRKLGKAVCVIIILVIIIFGIIFSIDQNRMKNNEPVLFSTWGAKYAPPVNAIDDNSEKNNNVEVESFVGTIIEEKASYILVEPNEDEPERKSADKISIGLDEKRDYFYGVGRKVIIEYSGYIMETYPAKINMLNILTDGYSDFEIIIKESEEENKEKILNNKDLYELNSDYNLYYVGLDVVNVKVNDKEMSLEDAVKNGYLSLEGIISKANKDFESGKITAHTYDDGGTMEYYYDDYIIEKRHTLSGDRDIYIKKK